VVFDETEFPFSKLHPNAGARLREEISLLSQNLINLSESEQLNDHVANLLDESDIFLEDLMQTGLQMQHI
jgi:hypothetical protein